MVVFEDVAVSDQRTLDFIIYLSGQLFTREIIYLL